MKKRVTALLLALCLLCTASLAGAESLYVALSAFLSDSTNESLYLGSGYRSTIDNDQKLCALWYDNEGQTIYMVGDDANGRGEFTMWPKIDAVTGLALLGEMYKNWDVYASLVDEGYTLAVGVQATQAEDVVWITDAAGAQEAWDALVALVGQNAQ